MCASNVLILSLARSLSIVHGFFHCFYYYHRSLIRLDYSSYFTFLLLLLLLANICVLHLYVAAFRFGCAALFGNKIFPSRAFGACLCVLRKVLEIYSMNMVYTCRHKLLCVSMLNYICMCVLCCLLHVQHGCTPKLNGFRPICCVCCCCFFSPLYSFIRHSIGEHVWK